MTFREARTYLNQRYLIFRKNWKKLKINKKIGSIYRDIFYDEHNQIIEILYEDLIANDWIIYFD